MKTPALLLLLSLAVLVQHASAGCFSWPSHSSIDKQTIISIRRKADGIQVYKFCPGVDYVVTVRFPEPRSLKVAAATGIWEALTGICPNQTEKTVASTTFQLPFTVPCDIVGELLAFKIASKAQLAATFLSKEIKFPVNPLSSCPKSRCSLITGTPNTTVTNMLTGLPLFDLFTKMGVTMGLGKNQLLTFDVSKLNKSMTPEAFLQVLMSIGQFKALSTKTLLDPTMVLSLLGKFSGAVAPSNSNNTAILFYKQCDKILSLWPTFWGQASTTGLSSSTYVDLATKLISASGGAYNATTLQAMFTSFLQPKNPADSLLNMMSAIGNILAEGDADFAWPSTPTVSVTSYMNLLGSFTSLLNAA